MARCSWLRTGGGWTGTVPGGSSARSPARAGSARPSCPARCRHAFITAALDAGVPLRDVQEAASHADPRTTMRYERARGLSGLVDAVGSTRHRRPSTLAITAACRQCTSADPAAVWSARLRRCPREDGDALRRDVNIAAADGRAPACHPFIRPRNSYPAPSAVVTSRAWPVSQPSNPGTS